MSVDNLARDALSMFSKGGGGDDVLLVLVPRSRGIFPVLQIPEACQTLIQTWGKNVGIGNPGLMFCMPWTRIAYCVTRQSSTYSAPVKRCPTRDNVMVAANLLVIFNIADPEDFVYKLGASNFDMMLSGSLEEALRKQIRNMDHGEVLALRGSKASDLLEVLNDKFREMGVVFTDCKVVDVELPRVLVDNHSYAKEMEITMTNLERDHRFQMGEIERQADISVRGVQRAAEAAIVTENGKKKQAQLMMEQRVQKMDENKRVQIITAEQNAKVREMEAKAALERKKVEMEKLRVTLVSDEEGILSSTKVTADLGYDMELVQAEADKIKYNSDAEALKLEGNAEAEAIRQLADKRKFELQIREREILGKMASAGNFNLIGESGDLIIGGIINGRVGRVQAVD